MRARDVHGRHLMLCADDDCRVYRVTDGRVVEVAGGQTPEGVAPGGLTTFGGSLPCVFGDGVYCLDDGGWLEMVASGSGPRFNAAAGAPTAIWAAGDEGRLVVASPTCTIEVVSGTSQALRSVSAEGARELWATAVGDGGVVVHTSLEDTRTCQVGSASWAVVHRTWGDNWGYGIAHEHDQMWMFGGSDLGIRGRPAAGGDWCTYNAGQEVVDVTVFGCGIMENPWAVTQAAVYGAADCAFD